MFWFVFLQIWSYSQRSLPFVVVGKGEHRVLYCSSQKVVSVKLSQTHKKTRFQLTKRLELSSQERQNLSKDKRLSLAHKKYLFSSQQKSRDYLTKRLEFTSQKDSSLSHKTTRVQLTKRLEFSSLQGWAQHTKSLEFSTKDRVYLTKRAQFSSQKLPVLLTTKGFGLAH